MRLIYAFEGFELDRGRYELRRDERPVPLEPQAFEVLAYLVEHRDRVVSKEELLDAVWGTRFVSESALTTRIKEARRALGDTGRDQRLIRTVIGRGYRFTGETARAPVLGRHAAGWPDAAPAAAPPGLVGRDAELERLEVAFEEALGRQRRVALVGGEAGSGKTSLLEELAVRIGRHGPAWIAIGQSLEHTGPGEPYGPVLDALSRLAREPDGDEVVAVLRRHAPTWLLELPGLIDEGQAERLRALTVGATAERMRREVLEALEELTVRRPMLLVLEDLHWSDAATLEVIAGIARRTAPARLVVAATYRPGGGADRLSGLVAELAPRRPACLQIELGALDREAAAAILAARLDGVTPPPELAALAVARGGGNPLFITALVDHWRSSGMLEVADGAVVLLRGSGDLAEVVGGDLRALIGNQVATLDPADREVAAAASVAGTAAPTAAVAAALGVEDEDAEAGMRRVAERSSVLSARAPARWPDGTHTALFAFRHSLYQQVLYDSLPLQRRARVHGRIGARLAAAFASEPAPHAAEIARHLAEGGRAREAVPWLLTAADVALGRSGHAEAVDLLEHAARLVVRLEEDGDRIRLEARTLDMLAPALIAVRGWAAPEVREAYERALELCRLLPDETPLESVLYGLATLHEYRAEYDRSRELMEQRLGAGARTPAAQVEAHELLACSRFHQGGFDDALQHAERALTAYSDEHAGLMAMYGENPAVSSRHWAAHALWFLGYPDRALARIEEALTLARRIAQAFSLAHAHEHAAHLHQYRLEPERALVHAEATVRLAAEQGYAYRAATGATLRGWALSAADPDGGLEEVTRGLEAYRATGAAMDLPYFLALLADAAARAGRHDAALAALDEAEAVLGGRDYYYASELLRLRAEVLHALGDRRGAARAGRDAITAARSFGARPLELRAAMSVLEHAPDERGRAGALAEVRVAYSTFTEGFATPDLRRARALLGPEGAGRA